MVGEEGLLGQRDGYFLVIYMVRGHTHNRLDQSNSKPREQYYKAEKIVFGSELVSVLNRSGRRYSVELFWPVRNFSEPLGRLMTAGVKETMTINKVHQLKICHEGIYTKKFNEEHFSEWRGRSPTTGAQIEPFVLMTDFPDLNPALVNIKSLSDDRIKTLQTTFGSKGQLEDVLREYTTLLDQPYVSLVDAVEPASPTQIMSEDDNELTVKDITHRRWNDKLTRYEWRTQWSDSSVDTWEPREHFTGRNGAINDIFKSYDEQHKPRYSPEEMVKRRADQQIESGNRKKKTPDKK